MAKPPEIQNDERRYLPPWRRLFYGFAKPLAKIMLTVFLGMFAFELVQNLLWPDRSPWQSHAAEVLYAATLASVVGYFVLRMHAVLYQQVLDENEKYRKSEEELRRSKEWFRSLTEHGTDLITVIDRNGAILYDSPSIERILGYRPIERLGKSGFDLVHPEDLPRARNTIAQAFQHLGSIHTVEVRMRGLDGRWHMLEATGKTMLDQHGQPYGVINSRDITERRLAEAAARQNEEHFRTLIENIQDVITILNPDGTISYESPSIEHVLGYKPEEMIGRNAFEFIHEEDQPRIVEALKKIVNRPEATASEELRFQHKDGSWRNLESVGKSLADPSGNVSLAVTTRDITKRKQMEHHSRRLEQLATISQLLGGVAHGLKNPMFVLTGRIQLVKEMLADRRYETLGEDLTKIEEAARRITSIIDRILLLAKPAKPETRLCSIQTVLQEVLDLLATELMQNRIQVVTSFAPALPATMSDPRQLQELFLNLILNAVQAMAEAHGKGTLTVTTRLADGWIETHVQDDGPGITPEHRSKLFEPFFSTKKPGEGTGMGLWNARVALMQLKGDVRCESEAGRGATFIVRLPVSA